MDRLKYRSKEHPLSGCLKTNKTINYSNMNRVIYLLFLLICSNQLFAQVDFKRALVEAGHFITCSHYSFDGKYLATAGTDNRLIIRQVETGEIIKQMNTQSPLRCLRFSLDGRNLFTAGNDNNIAVWDVDVGNVVRSFVGHSGPVIAIAISLSGNYIASGGTDHQVIIWDIETGQSVQSLSGSNATITSVAFHPYGQKVMAGSDNGYVYVWDVKTGKLENQFIAEEGGVNTIDVSPNGNFFATGGAETKIGIWNAYSCDLENTMFGHIDTVNTIGYSPDGRFIVSGSQDKYILIRNLGTGEIAFHSNMQQHIITSVAINPNGSEFASSSILSDTLKIWDLSALKIVPKLYQVLGKEVEEKPKPIIQWITEDNRESISLGYGVKYKLLAKQPVEKLNVYVNGERQVSEVNIEASPDEWCEFESIVYLNDGPNEVKVDLFYADGMVSLDAINISYNLALADELIQAARKRKITVWLRETDEYEYVIRGAEGYLFHSEKIKVEEKEEANIDVELVPLQEEVSIVLNNITFPTNSAELTPESFVELDRVVDLLKTNPKLTIEISAHTDNVGSEAYNMLLSNRRAQSVVNYLLDYDVEPERLVAKGYGPKKPMVPNTSDENRATNRRVEFKIIDLPDKQNTENNDEL
jgi:WD40 repeat protein